MNNQENIELNLETFDNVLDMLNSPDTENHTVAFLAIETADFKKNLTYILLLKKECKLSPNNWNGKAPKTMIYLKSLDIIPERSMTYKKVFEILLDQRVSAVELQFFINRFSKFILQDMHNIPGYDDVESLTFTLKMKENYDNNDNITLNPS